MGFYRVSRNFMCVLKGVGCFVEGRRSWWSIFLRRTYCWVFVLFGVIFVLSWKLALTPIVRSMVKHVPVWSSKVFFNWMATLNPQKPDIKTPFKPFQTLSPINPISNTRLFNVSLPRIGRAIRRTVLKRRRRCGRGAKNGCFVVFCCLLFFFFGGCFQFFPGFLGFSMVFLCFPGFFKVFLGFYEVWPFFSGFSGGRS